MTANNRALRAAEKQSATSRHGTIIAEPRKAAPSYIVKSPPPRAHPGDEDVPVQRVGILGEISAELQHLNNRVASVLGAAKLLADRITGAEPPLADSIAVAGGPSEIGTINAEISLAHQQMADLVREFGRLSELSPPY